MIKISEATFDRKGNITFRWAFRVGFFILLSIVSGLYAFGFNQVTAKIDDSKIKNEDQDGRLNKLEVSMGKMDIVADDVKDVKNKLDWLIMRRKTFDQ